MRLLITSFGAGADCNAGASGAETGSFGAVQAAVAELAQMQAATGTATLARKLAGLQLGPGAPRWVQGACGVGAEAAHGADAGTGSRR